MDKYRSKLKIQSIFIGAAAAALLSVIVLSALRVIAPIAGASRWIEFWNGFISGVSAGMLPLLLVGLVRIFLALRSEKRLRQMYINENDERRLQIVLYALSRAMQIYLLLGLVSGIIAGYFSISVSITIIACTVVASIIGAGCKFYYSKKF